MIVRTLNMEKQMKLIKEIQTLFKDLIKARFDNKLYTNKERPSKADILLLQDLVINKIETYVQ